MRTIIIEDEIIAAEALKKSVLQIEPEAEIETILQTVEESVEWLQTHQQPDLIFVDIHLADGSSFAIFEQVDVKCPVIFTTAYDEYALKAFKINSIDYLLKPINKDELQRALNKYKHLHGNQNDYSMIIKKFVAEIENNEKSYKSYFLVPERDKLIPLPVKDIAFIYIDIKTIKAITFSGKTFYMNQNLEDLMSQLNPRKFFRANRQYIVAHEAIKDVSLWFGNKISLNLTIPVEEKIIVSKARVPEFKTWFST